MRYYFTSNTNFIKITQKNQSKISFFHRSSNEYLKFSFFCNKNLIFFFQVPEKDADFLSHHTFLDKLQKFCLKK